ncbi:hypothetical protein OUZ56_000888 [Daphnia magna]|uniref:Uncharacterized protein n=1 Tax=Daphnia magna TaxID=35525 RepID=A0ABR0A120_9CRUS|nr:hypothetical protein OUZ56_000888 [Daphnia magna]
MRHFFVFSFVPRPAAFNGPWHIEPNANSRDFTQNALIAPEDLDGESTVLLHNKHINAPTSELSCYIHTVKTWKRWEDGWL